MAIDLRELMARHGHNAFLTPFNVGNARRRPAPRGHRTFVPLASWLRSRWETEAQPGRAVRVRSHPPTEIAIEGSVPDAMDLLLEARPMGPGEHYADEDETGSASIKRFS